MIQKRYEYSDTADGTTLFVYPNDEFDDVLLGVGADIYSSYAVELPEAEVKKLIAFLQTTLTTTTRVGALE